MEYRIEYIAAKRSSLISDRPIPLLGRSEIAGSDETAVPARRGVYGSGASRNDLR
jgi:hypothetical protein